MSDDKDGEEGKDKVLKLAPERVGELLPLDTIAAPLVFQPRQSSEASPTRRARSNTLTNPPRTGARPSIAFRTLSTPPSSRRVVTTSANTVRRRESTERRMPSPAPKRKSSGSITTTTVIHNYSGDANYDSPGTVDGESDRRVSSRHGSDQAPTPLTVKPASSSFRPMHFQTYLSQALASPTPAAFADTTPVYGKDDDASQKAGTVYGSPPHSPDDSAAIAMERILNFFLLPPKLEGAMIFGVLACLDSWLYIFTILPLRFLKAIGVLMHFWRMQIWDYFFYDGNKLRKKQRKDSLPSAGSGDQEKRRDRKKRKEKKVSGLNSNHKADILRGMVLFTSCWFLMRFDASKMYHSIRGQSGIKLYVIYNMLDVSPGAASEFYSYTYGVRSSPTNCVRLSDKTYSMFCSLEKCLSGVPMAAAKSGDHSDSFFWLWPTTVRSSSPPL
jgi:hypothetical protein